MIVQLPDYIVTQPWEAGYIFGIAALAMLAVVALAIADYWLRSKGRGDDRRREEK